MSKGFEKILDECLERLIQGESIEECLARYPEQAVELEPLLKAALTVREASALKPRPELKAQIGSRLRSVIEVRGQRRVFRLGWGWALAIGMVLFLMIASTSTVVAASGSLPDEPLYPVKIAMEHVRLWLTPSDMGKAKLHARFVNRRIDEIAQMAGKDKPEVVARVIHRLEGHLEVIPRLVREREIHALRQFLEQNAATNLGILHTLEEKKPALGPALKRAREIYTQTLHAIEEVEK